MEVFVGPAVESQVTRLPHPKADEKVNEEASHSQEDCEDNGDYMT